MNLTIAQVYPQPRTFSGKFGPGAAVKVTFDDGSEGDYITTPEKAQEHIARLQALIRAPSEFTVEARPDYNGTKQWRIKDYPGRPQGQQGGGGSSGKTFVPAYHQTAEGEHFIQERMDRRTALMQAVALEAKQETPMILGHASAFYRWLRETAGDKPAATPAPAPQSQEWPVAASQSAGTEPDPFSPEFDDVPTYPAPVPASLTVNPIWEGPGQCQSCHAPAGRPHGRPCR